MKSTLRFEVFKRDAFTCRYCGRRSPEVILEVDHAFPRSAGGSDEMENLVTSCFECNRGKGARLLSDIPPEENLHEKAICIAEHELQLAEYNHWRAKQKAREDEELRYIYRLWMQRWEYIPSYWQESTVLTFLRKLGVYEVGEVMQYACEHADDRYSGGKRFNAWRAFCGICWHRIKNPREE